MLMGYIIGWCTNVWRPYLLIAWLRCIRRLDLLHIQDYSVLCLRLSWVKSPASFLFPQCHVMPLKSKLHDESIPIIKKKTSYVDLIFIWDLLWSATNYTLYFLTFLLTFLASSSSCFCFPTILHLDPLIRELLHVHSGWCFLVLPLSVCCIRIHRACWVLLLRWLLAFRLPSSCTIQKVHQTLSY